MPPVRNSTGNERSSPAPSRPTRGPSASSSSRSTLTDRHASGSSPYSASAPSSPGTSSSTPSRAAQKSTPSPPRSTTTTSNSRPGSRSLSPRSSSRSSRAPSSRPSQRPSQISPISNSPSPHNSTFRLQEEAFPCPFFQIMAQNNTF
jgi:hypothetical protein